VHDRAHRRPLLASHDRICERKSPGGPGCRDRRGQRRLVSNTEATELEAAIKEQREELGRAEQLTVRGLRQTGTGR
jgi:hypothetical protein